MILKVKEIKPEGLVFEGENNIALSNKARIPGTVGMHGYGVVDAITYYIGAKAIRVQWAHPLDKPNIKVGDEIKFTRK